MKLSTQKRGSQLPQSKLTEQKVADARREYMEGRQKIQALQRRYSIAGLADRYGVSASCMEKVLARKAWEHVE